MDDAFAMLLAVSMAAQCPHEAAALVRLPTIHAYLTARGWTPGRSPAWTFGGGIVWNAPTGAEPDDDYGVVLPNREAILDYSRRVAEASLGVGVEESRSGTHVLAAWLYSQWQTGTFRVTP
jgi:hypothetical protein